MRLGNWFCCVVFLLSCICLLNGCCNEVVVEITKERIREIPANASIRELHRAFPGNQAVRSEFPGLWYYSTNKAYWFIEDEGRRLRFVIDVRDSEDFLRSKVVWPVGLSGVLLYQAMFLEEPEEDEQIAHSGTIVEHKVDMNRIVEGRTLLDRVLLSHPPKNRLADFLREHGAKTANEINDR